jgi:hypothetical protein
MVRVSIKTNDKQKVKKKKKKHYSKTRKRMTGLYERMADLQAAVEVRGRQEEIRQRGEGGVRKISNKRREKFTMVRQAADGPLLARHSL